MFRRRTSQKPSENLYMEFKNTFPALGQTSSTVSPRPIQTPQTASDKLDLHYDAEHVLHDSRDDHRSSSEFSILDPWKTPGILESNAALFANFESEHGGFWPQTPSGSGLPSSAGGFNLPELNMGLQTLVSSSVPSLNHLPASSNAFTMKDFMLSTTPNAHMPHNPFNYVQPFIPNAFSNQNSGRLSNHGHDFRIQDHSYDQRYPNGPAAVRPVEQRQDEPTQFVQSREAREQFRFRVILKASTAMIKSEAEIPITYLNKCQTYSITVADTMPDQPSGLINYRTAIRVTFEDEQQRARPAACWQLWKEGRGINEAHRRGGKLQAVEYVNPDQGHGQDSISNMQMNVTSFDGFSFTWTGGPERIPECTVQVRFNFLSTDFSHSKGVKGIPVRLCAKTEILPSKTSQGIQHTRLVKEICYCSVKTFRDHGAERKLANDKLHVTKNIQKLEDQVKQAEKGLKENGKRRRSDSNVASRPTKVVKHKRTWSVSSRESSNDESQEGGDDELLARLKMYKSMTTSIRSGSLFYLRGEDQDDLDAYPVQLPGGSLDVSTRPPVSSLNHASTQNTSTDLSPTPSSRSPKTFRRQSSSVQNAPATLPTPKSNEWPVPPSFIKSEAKEQTMDSPTDGPRTVQKVQCDVESNTGEWIEALEIDQAYQAPSEQVPKSVACFYIKPSIDRKPATDDYYRAIYLAQRNLDCLIHAITEKCCFKHSCIVRTIRVNKAGIRIKVEDQMVQELPEGQDIIVELDKAEEHDATAEDFFSSHELSTPLKDSPPEYWLTLRY